MDEQMGELSRMLLTSASQSSEAGSLTLASGGRYAVGKLYLQHIYPQKQTTYTTFAPRSKPNLTSTVHQW